MVGKNLKTIRENKKMTRKDVEVLTGVKVARLSEYERDKRMPRVNKMKVLANVLGVKVSDFFQ